MITLILGGARSGKSAYAEKLMGDSRFPVTYIATAQVYDDEFAKRVKHHQARRPKDWKTIEAPHYLADAMEANIHKGHSLIIDCLTLWLAQCICPECVPPKGVSWQAERAKFLSYLEKFEGNLILVSNEVGMGIVPLGAINRQFQDEQGRLNQAVAALADKVFFIASGLPLKLKG
jgi:adenosylcobinamide kinase / adenosylcobinamide-phosphate guanylyltransferase